MPLTPNGKIDRQALPAPESSGLASHEQMVLPRTPVEEQLAGIWSAVLGVKPIGVFDSFFELGGHSLLAMQVISRVRSSLQVAISLNDLFETRTIAGFADVVERARRVAAMPAISDCIARR
jgi:acyl carrier protein